MTSRSTADFISFWNSAQLALGGHAEAVYSVQHSQFGDIMPLPYPPPFLLLVAPFGVLPFGWAFTTWILTTGALYVWAAQSRIAFANPGAAFNGMIGQTGFLTSGLLLGGIERPALLGLLVIKPHLAVLVPVALVAGKQWRALGVAALSAVALVLLALAVFGINAYRGFLAVAVQFAALLETGRWPWSDLASVYAVARWFGASASSAWLAHDTIAIGATVLTWWAWRDDWPTKVPVLCSATLLISPYLFAYSAVLMVAPLTWLAKERPITAAAIWLLLAMQLLRVFGLYIGPNTVSLAALLGLTALARRTSRQRPRQTKHEPATAAAVE